MLGEPGSPRLIPVSWMLLAIVGNDPGLPLGGFGVVVTLGLGDIVLDSVLDGDSAEGMFSRFVDNVITAITAAIRTTITEPASAGIAICLRCHHGRLGCGGRFEAYELGCAPSTAAPCCAKALCE